MIDIKGEMRDVAAADLVVLFAPEEGLAWVHYNRQGRSNRPKLEGLDLKGAVALLIDLDEGTAEARSVLDGRV